jgi:hypothetical protein
VNRHHPSRWPLVIWLVIATGAALLRVPYTLGGFSFAAPAALLAGTWLGWQRAVPLQALAAAALIPFGLLLPQAFPELNSVGEWGFRVGLVAAAGLAGALATPDDSGARPSRMVRLAVFGAAGATAGLATIVVPRQSSGVLFGAAFVLATTIAAFYAYRMVPEPGRVVGYVFCLLPYWGLGLGWSLLVARTMPASAALAGIPERWHDVVFHAFLTRLPSELIAVVVISYLLCALDRGGTARGPMAVGASRR